MQNVQHFCKIKGVRPTIACVESGAGRNFISYVKRGQTPSVPKVQLLATYLGVTTSQLLGEADPQQDHHALKPDIVECFEALPLEAQKEVLDFIEFKKRQHMQ